MTINTSSSWSECGVVHGSTDYFVQVPHQPWRRKELLCTLHGQVEGSNLLALPLLDDTCSKCCPFGICVAVLECLGQQDRICDLSPVEYVLPWHAKAVHQALEVAGISFNFASF